MVSTLKLDQAGHTATVVGASTLHGGTFHSEYMGSTQILPNGNAVVGWGGEVPFVSEYSASGKLIFWTRRSPCRT